MNLYRVCRPVYRPIDSVYWTLRFETVLLLKADSPEHAIELAKLRGVCAPVVELAKEKLQ
jgi:hypothetical protein